MEVDHSSYNTALSSKNLVHTHSIFEEIFCRRHGRNSPYQFLKKTQQSCIFPQRDFNCDFNDLKETNKKLFSRDIFTF